MPEVVTLRAKNLVVGGCTVQNEMALDARRADEEGGMRITADPILVAAEKCLDRTRAEMRILAAVARLQRFGISLAERHGIRAHHFAGDDTRLIYAAIRDANNPRAATGPGERRTLAARLAGESLAERGLWDGDDRRAVGTGMRWGPERLVELFFSLSEREAEQSLPGLAADLLKMEVA
jgi:hypothetical protein